MIDIKCSNGAQRNMDSLARTGTAAGARVENPVSERDEVFPDSQRVIFEKAPLIQVVSQVLFPTILKIAQPPANFQERIRSEFPLYERGVEVNFPQGGAQQLPPHVLQILRNQAGGMPHRFLTARRDATVTLTTESLSLSTSKYTRWEHFLNLFRLPLAALSELYVPSFFTRVGLRYVNAIQREMVGLAPNRPWSQLIVIAHGPAPSSRDAWDWQALEGEADGVDCAD